MSEQTSLNIPNYETLSLSLSDHVATVSLDRADKANAMNSTMWQEIEACFVWLDREPMVRVVVLAAKGKHFCSGIDLSLFAQLQQSIEGYEEARKTEEMRRVILSLQGNLTAIERCRKPVLAAIQGSCIGGGVDMVSCCDMRYCSEEAYFSIKEIDIAMTADVGTLQRLPHIIGDGILRELAYTGRNVEPSEAKALGLVNEVYQDEASLLEGVQAIAASIAQKSPLAIRGTKEMILYTRDHPVTDGLNYIATWNAGMLSNNDVMTAITANLNGETPVFDN